MKLIIQIPCLNEESTLPQTLADLPQSIDGIESIELLVIDDGSQDRTVEIAREHGVHHIVSFSSNRGLAAAFRAGLQKALEEGADLIVNTDGDNQYNGADIEVLVRPVLDHQADMVIGDRQISKHKEFSPLKKCLQRLGSWVIGSLAGTTVPDATSGFRAYSRQAALQMNILTQYTYTHETILQAGLLGLKIASVPVRVNPKTRQSRLFRSMSGYIRRSMATILRIYLKYKALKVFALLALMPFLAGSAIGVRFFYYYIVGQGDGKVQSLILCAVLLNLSFVLFVLGVLADLIGFNRQLIEEVLVLERKRSLEEHRNDSEKSASKLPGENAP